MAAARRFAQKDQRIVDNFRYFAILTFWGFRGIIEVQKGGCIMLHYVIRVVIDGVPHSLPCNGMEVATSKVICESWFGVPVEVIREEDYDPFEEGDEESE